MEIRTEIDIKRLTRFLKKKLKNKEVIAFNLERMDAPTAKQLRLINAIPKELAIKSAERGYDGLTCADFRNMIVDIFLSDYFDILPDGQLFVRPASFKHGMTKQELGNVISSVFEYFNVYFGFDITLLEPKSEKIKKIAR